MAFFKLLKKYFNDDNFCFILYCNILFVFSLILLYFFLKIYFNSSLGKSDFIVELIQDLDRIPIYDLKSELNDFEYKYYSPIVFGRWKGADVGCYCNEFKKGICSKEDVLNGCINQKGYNNNSIYYGNLCRCSKLTKGYCSEENIRMLCWTVDALPSRVFSKYKKTSFHAKRPNFDYNYLQLLYSNKIIEKNQKCPDGMKPCGKIDSLDNILCLDKKDECPINNIKFDHKPFLAGYKNEKLAADDNTFYHFNNNETNKKIISNFFIFQGVPCYDSQEYNWINFNILEKGNNKTGCKTINGKIKDFRYDYLDSENQFQLYKDIDFYGPNPIFNYIDEKSKEKMKNTMVNLYYRNFIGYNISQLKKNNIKDLLSILSKLYELVETERLFYAKNFRLFKEIYEIFENPNFISLLISVLIFIFILFIKTKYSEIIDATIKILIPELILFIDIFYNVIDWKIKPSENKFQIIDKIFDCCDEYTQYQLTKLKKNRFDFTYFWNYKFYLILLAISSLLFLITLLLSFYIKQIYLRYFCYKKNENDKEEKPLVPNEEEGKELDNVVNNVNEI